jgi:hypothetical protein
MVAGGGDSRTPRHDRAGSPLPARLLIAFRCSFDATYRSADGITHTKHLDYETLLSGVPNNLKFSVHYDPASPTRISTSWGEDLLLGRTVVLVIAVTCIAILAVYFPVMLVLTWFRIGRKAAIIGADPIPLVARLCRTSMPYQPFGSWLTLGLPPDRKVEFRWTDPKTEQMFFDETVFKGSTQPFCLDAARTKMLALASRSGQAHLLDAELATVDLTDRERSIVFEAKVRVPEPDAASRGISQNPQPLE